jgi:molybdate transport system permease protein
MASIAERVMRRPGSTCLTLASALLPLYIAIPLVALALAVPPRQLLLHLISDEALRALLLSVRTTAVATILCIVFGTPLAYVLARRRFRGRDALDTLVDLPVTIPPVVAGLALLMALGRRGLLGRSFEAAGIQIPFTTAAVVLAQVFIASPFFVKATRAGFEGVDRSLEMTARTLGASPWRVFWTVTVPLARPALVAGTVLAWARALSEFGATMMFAGNLPGRTQTLPLAVMSAMESDLETAIAVSMISLLLAAAALLLARRLGRAASLPLLR